MLSFKRPLILAAILACCTIVIQMGNTGKYFGRFYDRFFPCEEIPWSSAPCYIGVDVMVSLIAALIWFVCAGILAFDLYKRIRGWLRTNLQSLTPSASTKI
jgi:hypothetical protein